ncbi:MAG: hypothetical protein ACRDKH_03895 [Solirubrobacterales bacterium]
MVKAITVELDGEPVQRPAAIKAEASEEPVGFRRGKTGFFDASEEAGLELAQGDSDLAPEDSLECRPPLRVRSEGEHVLDLPWCRAVANLGFMAGAGEHLLGQVGGEIHERSRDRDHGNPPASSDRSDLGSAGPLDDDAGDAAGGWR